MSLFQRATCAAGVLLALVGLMLPSAPAALFVAAGVLVAALGAGLPESS